jgi:hypothetical protein
MTAGQYTSPFTFSKILVGKGIWPEGTDESSFGSVGNLLAPVAEATSTVPTYDGDTVRFTIEYRSDMNGGLANGFWLSEYGIFVANPDDPDNRDADILLLYAGFSAAPQWVSAYGKGSWDVRRFPVSIIIGEGMVIDVKYDTVAFMNAEDVAEYCNVVILPMIIARIEELIEEHNEDSEAHPNLHAADEALAGRLDRLEEMYLNDVTGNPFIVTFENLDGVEMEGTWNKGMRRIEF